MEVTPSRRAFLRALRDRLPGEVRFDSATLGAYSTDASIYQIRPLAVCTPKNEESVKAAVGIAAHHRVAVLGRGGGTSLAGQSVTDGLVIDFTPHMNRLLEFNAREGWARVEPGLVRDELNAAVAAHGLQFAPDPATANRATVGGMSANNSSGTRSIVYGKTVDHILECRVLLPTGEIVEFKDFTPDKPGEGAHRRLAEGLKSVVQKNAAEIRARFPKVMRSVGGYNLNAFVDAATWNLSKLFVGSEGTLCTLLSAKVKLIPLPKATALCVVHFREVLDSIRGVSPILSHKPSAVELVDRVILTLARKNLSTAELCGFVAGDPAAVLAVEFFGETAAEALDKAQALAANLSARGIGYVWPVFADAAGQAAVWTVRRHGLGLMEGVKGDRKPLSFIEDACVPVEVLPDYIARVLEVCKAEGVETALYAHASVGVLHVKPMLNLKRRDDVERMKRIADKTFALVQSFSGAWSGEHGDGLIRSAYMERFYGPHIYAAFKQVKSLFDPKGIMNPGKIVDAPPMDQNLRHGASSGGRAASSSLQGVYHYRAEGAFSTAVEMCTGVGACRKTLGGTMCPSYMATRDEVHTTRGRANLLRLAMTHQLGEGGLANPEVYGALDLCLSCKGCKAECPSNVDMAKLKSEFLQNWYDKRGTGLRDFLISETQSLAAINAGWQAPLVNLAQESGLFKWAMEKFGGFDRRRTLPAYAAQTFEAWFEARPAQAAGERPRVALFCDTYLNFYEPSVGRAAVTLLESLGYHVVLARPGCCQRPRISHGFLRAAKAEGTQTLEGLRSYFDQKIPVVVCEPSCASALTDDLPDLVDDAGLARQAAAGIFMIDVFLAAEAEAGKLEGKLKSSSSEVLIHGHCHQKALYGTQAMKTLLAASGAKVTEVDSGCCGMAGSFGYEKEHYALSQQIAEQRLLPAVRAAGENTAVVACGFSCRHQISDFSERKAQHFVEVLAARSSATFSRTL